MSCQQQCTLSFALLEACAAIFNLMVMHVHTQINKRDLCQIVCPDPIEAGQVVYLLFYCFIRDYVLLLNCILHVSIEKIEV